MYLTGILKTYRATLRSGSCVTICDSSKTGRALGVLLFEVGGQKKGCFYGREDVSDIGGQEKCHYSGRHAPDRGCQRQLTGVKIVAKKKPGSEPGEFFACYKRNKVTC